MNADLPTLTNTPESDAWQAARAQYCGDEPPEALEVALLARFAEQRARSVVAPVTAVAPASGRWQRWLGVRAVPGLRAHLSQVPQVSQLPRRPALIGSFFVALIASISVLWWQVGTPSVAATTPFMLVSEPSSSELNVAQLVRVNVPREAMLDFGIPVPPQQLQDEVRAEMLLGQRGEVIAVRFIEQPEHKRSFFY